MIIIRSIRISDCSVRSIVLIPSLTLVYSCDIVHVAKGGDIDGKVHFGRDYVR